jgi:DNA transposition AAA+ family ATPase
MSKEDTDKIVIQRMSIPGDHVQTALARLLDDGEITEADKAEIWWFYSYCMDRGFTLEDAGKAIDRDATTAYRLFVGRYGAKYDNLVDTVKRYHKLADARGNRKVIGFVETTTWKKIEQVCRHALVGQLPAFVFGDSQIGKTTCLEEFARRNNHGQTKYIRMPAAPSFLQVQREIAKACYISTRATSTEILNRIFDSISDQMLLIIDEMHQPLIGCCNSTAVRIIEWLREIYDRTGCGIVFCGTRVFRDEIENGRLALILEQFRRRGIIRLQLPSTPPKADINKIADAFGLPPPEGDAADIITQMLKQSGLGQYVKFLQSASNLAAKQKMEMSWDHFVIAYDVIQKLSNKE